MTAFIASVLVKVTVVTAVALAGSRLARRARAAVRHVWLAAAFGVLLVLPIASLVVPAIGIPVPIAMPEEAASPTPADIPPVAETTAATELSVRAAAPRRSLVPSWQTLAAGAWIAGTLLVLLPALGGLRQVRRLRRSAVAWRAGQDVVDRIAADAGIGRRVDLLLHEWMPGPMTCGVLHPAIVLPAEAREWSAEDLHRAILHELEHVRRGDWGVQCLARVICACYWFHPLVWTASRQLALEAERACDDAVLRRGDATAYADQLVLLAERLSGAQEQPLLAMANRDDLATRVGAVLDHRQPRGRAGARWIALAIAASATILMTMSPLRIVATARQTEAQTPAPKFDAASVKPCRVEDSPPGPARGTAGGTNATFSPGRMHVPCVTLQQLIYLAYAAYGASAEERLANDNPGAAANDTKVRGGPSWVRSQRDKYTVEATAAGATERTVLLGTMLRTLLEERFKLKIRREIEEVPMFALTTSKSGFKVKPMKEGECDPDHDRQPTMDPDAKPLCGGLTMGGRGPNAVWRFAGFPVSALAGRLSGAVGRHVIDRTGIEGEFIYRLEFHPDENTPGIRWPPERDADTSAPMAASLFTALEEQLGLKLENTRAPRGFLVIDHVERPTPDRGPALFEPLPQSIGPGSRGR